MRLTLPGARTLSLAIIFGLACNVVLAQDTPVPQPGRQGQIPGGIPGAGRAGVFGQRQAVVGPRPYSEVITEKAKSEVGLFTVHRIDDKVYYEIPSSAMNREMLWTTEIAQLPAGQGYGGTAVNNKMVRWSRRGNKVYLRLVDVTLRAEQKGAIRSAIEAASLDPIVMAFDVEAEGKDKAPVIEVTRLINSDTTEFSVRNRLGGSAVDPSRSYIEKVKAFPTNVEVQTLYTFAAGGAAGFGGAQPGPSPTPSPAPAPRTPRAFPRAGGGSITALIHYSMTLLPEKPMMGRLKDSRVGYFSDRFEDFGRDEHRVVERSFINRYRLEKKDPTAKISEPVKPIVYYLSREVPEKWRPFMKKGVEDWNEAFEAAGFKNAIVCKDAPSLEEDPNWDPEDARYSVIRWAPSTVENAQGPHVSDPRSGEIISAHIIVWHNVLKLGETWYFTQVSPLDARAQRLPLPESLMGDIVQYIVSHEVGHTLGLEHNFKASSAYSAAQLRSKEFTEKNGDEASIMDYGRFNYVAQPGDNARLIPKIGPYDKFAISWGYTPIETAHAPDDEKARLDEWASAQVSNPMLRFGNKPERGRMEDPTEQREDLGSNPIEATRYGLKNIARVMQILTTATVKFGDDYDLLKEMYEGTLDQRQRELGHVVDLVGGVIETDFHAGRGSEVFHYVPKQQQAEAVHFLIDNSFKTPTELLLPNILMRIEPSGVADRILAGQSSILSQLLSVDRVKRLAEAQALSPLQAYSPGQLMSDVQNGVWTELQQPQPSTDLYRRNLQRSYIELFKPILTGDTQDQSERRSIARGCLMELKKGLETALPKVKDRDTQLHFQDCKTQIERILNPKV